MFYNTVYPHVVYTTPTPFRFQLIALTLFRCHDNDSTFNLTSPSKLIFNCWLLVRSGMKCEDKLIRVETFFRSTIYSTVIIWNV